MPDLELPDGRIIQDIPEGLSKDQITSKLISSGILTGKEDWLGGQKTEGLKSYAPFVSDKKLQRNIQSAYESSQQEAGLFRGFGKGLGNALVGGVQAATDLGESAARGIEKGIYGDVMPQQTFGNRLAGEVTKLKQDQENLPTSEKIGIGLGEVAPYVGVGAGMGLLKGSTAASALASFLSPREEADLGKRTGKAVEAGVEGALIGGTINLAGNIARTEPVQKFVAQPIQKLLGKTKDFTAGIKDRLISQFGPEIASKEASETIAKKTLTKGFEREGVNAKELLDNLQKNDYDLIDALDTRFATYGKVKGALSSPDNIKKVDSSLANIKQSTDDLQKSLTSMVATKQLTPEEAGEVLGRNSKKIFERAIEARRLRADPIYAKGLNAGTKVDLATVIPIGEESVNLGQFLKSNFAQNLIKNAREKSESFAGTPAQKFYGKIFEKTKSGEYKIPDNDVRTLYAVETALTDRIGEIAQTGATKEEAALSATKKAISNLLDKANPDLKKARSLWSSDTKNIKSEGKSLIGKFAKMYDEGRKDDLAKAAMNVLDLPERAIKLAKKSAPDEFNEILRSSIENKISSIRPLDDSVIGAKPFQTALFKDGGKNLKTALGNDEAFNGFKKLAVQLDRGQSRQRLAKGAMESEAKAVNIATGKTSFINRVLEKGSDMLLNSPQANAKLVDYALTEEGRKVLGELAKGTTAKESEKALLKIFTKSGLVTKDDIYRALAVAGGKNDLIDIFPYETNLNEK